MERTSFASTPCTSIVAPDAKSTGFISEIGLAVHKLPAKEATLRICEDANQRNISTIALALRNDQIGTEEVPLLLFERNIKKKKKRKRNKRKRMLEFTPFDFLIHLDYNQKQILYLVQHSQINVSNNVLIVLMLQHHLHE